MSAPPDDGELRREALDPGRSFIVQAPAGSGKTELLMQRFLVLLARVEAPEEVLALTFTRKAATEMRNRILQALARAADDRPPGEGHERLTWRLAREALEADRARGWNLRLSPARLRIQTIDALCAGLARRAPLLSGLSQLPRVLEDANALYREAARQTIAEIESGEAWSRAIEHLLRHLDNNVGVIEGLIAAMLARREQWLRHSMQRIDRRRLEATLADVGRDAVAALGRALPAGLAAEMAACLAYAARNRLDAGEQAAALERLAGGVLPGSGAEDLEAWQAAARIFLTEDGGWRKGLTARSGFPPPSAAKGAEAERLRHMKERMAALIERLSGEASFHERLAALRGLPPARYTDAQWDTIGALAELLQLAVGLLHLLFRERGELDFIEVSHAALRALGPEDEPTDLALLLDRRLSHVLVDEFQDTSLTQYELLERLTAGWQAGDGRTVFVVGDPMQSIYRFREADVGLYLRARAQGIGGVRLDPLQLVVNHRSQRGIVRWVNAAFAAVLPAADDMASGAIRHWPAEARHGELPGEAVTVHPLVGEEDGQEAALVARLASGALAEADGATVAVLVRNRAHLIDIVPALREAGLRFRAVEIERLAHRPVVQDLMALTLALCHPADRVSWLAVLRAPWCGLTLADLHALAADAPRATVWELMSDATRCARLSEDGRGRLARLREVLSRSLAERRRRPLRRWVEGAWLALGGPACLPEATDLEDAAVVFEVLEAIDDGGEVIERGALAERIDRLYARPDVAADGRLQLMTIHKAKGLQFDTVIVPGLGRAPRNSQASLLMSMERPQGDLLLAPIPERGAERDPIYEYLCELERRRGRHEDGRLLYVAVTRARRRVHLIGGVRRPREGEPARADQRSLLGRLFPVVEAAFAAALERAAAGAVTPAVPPAPVIKGSISRLGRDWRGPEPPPALRPVVEPALDVPGVMVEYEWAGETARHVGTVTHRLLQQCARAGLDDFSRLSESRLRRLAVAALSREGVPLAAVEAAAERVTTALRATLADGRGRWILSPDHAEARSEYALSGVHEGRLRSIVLDRTFVDATGVRWIIDYKTGAHEGGGVEEFLDRERERYRQQLETYAAMMRPLEPRRPIRLGLYFPLLGGWREWGDDGPPATLP
jgi:ATP-dependent exoDNAse (exonuclease V) beta subunit